MKRILSLAGRLALAVLISMAFTIDTNAQEKKTERHIKMVRVDDQGNKTEIDTVIKGDDVFVWQGDTIGGGKELKWVAKEGDFDFDFDTDMKMGIKMDEDENGNVFILKSGDKKAPVFITTEGDSLKKEYRVKVVGVGEHGDHDVLMWNEKDHNKIMIGAPHGAHPGNVMFIGEKKGNVIDLSDPGIISFEKKELKDGREKITIVREKPDEKEVNVHKEVIVTEGGDHSMILHKGHPGEAKRVKVFVTEDGKAEVIEEGGTWTEEEGEDVKVIEKDGKKITIKKIKEGGEVKVDVEVEEKKENKEERK